MNNNNYDNDIIKQINVENRLENVENRLENVENRLEKIDQTLIRLNSSVELLISKLERKDDEMLQECKKMGAHIDFIENVYDNVKHPLGYICNKIKYVTGNNYNLTNNLTDTDSVAKLQIKG